MAATDRTFAVVGDMENSIATIRDLLRALAMIAETLSEDDGAVVQRLASLGLRECKVTEDQRGELFRLTHPDREHFEAVGWP